MNDEFNEDLTEEFDTVTMTDELGNDVEFAILDSIEDGSNKYLLVIESDKMDDEAADAAILKEISDDNENLEYELIEDDEEFNKISLLFQQSGSGEYDFEID